MVSSLQNTSNGLLAVSGGSLPKQGHASNDAGHTASHSLTRHGSRKAQQKINYDDFRPFTKRVLRFAQGLFSRGRTAMRRN